MGEITRGFKLFQPWANDVARLKNRFNCPICWDQQAEILDFVARIRRHEL